MLGSWTFGRKVSAGFAVTVGLSITVAAVATIALHRVVESKDRVILINSRLLVDAQRLDAAVEKRRGSSRAYLMTHDERYLEEMQEARREIGAVLDRLADLVLTAEGRRSLEAIGRADQEHRQALDRVIAMRGSKAPPEAVEAAFEQQVVPTREALGALVRSFTDREERLLAEATEASSRTASSAIFLVTVLAAAIALVSVLAAVLLTRAVTREVGTAVGQVQSSSAELQSAAGQQAVGARQQATAMNEIATTINELLSTSRQISESSQRVTRIAEQTAAAARSGEGTVQKAHELIGGVRRQVDVIVGHMLELGKDSQQIGSVLDIVSELAEQTNILAINATIEAAGAGEAGQRFAVVAEEIRKLADRVADSTKEIRGLIEAVRGAVNTTVMATESGSKAAEAGTRQFAEVTSAFGDIAALVTTTTDAAKEIELSTKQQTTAVEQVNAAISNVAQAVKETEASAGQTLQTASQLAGLSRDLSRLIQPRAGG